MKKMKICLLLLFGLAFFVSPEPATGQNAFAERVNVALFTGGFCRQQNTNNNGGWLGAYMDFVPLRSYNGWAAGIFGSVSTYTFRDNDLENIYTGHGWELAGGLNFGKYSEYFSLRHAAFIGCNLGIRKSRDTGLGRNKYGQSDIVQEDWVFSVNLNMNSLKNGGLHERLFPRFQVMLNFAKPYKSQASAAWNGKALEDQAPWPKSYFDIIVKESLVAIGINRGRDLLLEPKLLASYRYEQGSQSSFLVIGAELGLRNDGRDDILALFVTQKRNFSGQQSYFTAGINICPLNIRK